MKKMIVNPDGWECTLLECPAGFFVFDGELCFKSEYSTQDQQTKKYYSDIYCSTGSYFWGGVNSSEDRNKLTVQPVIVEWEEFEE